MRPLSATADSPAPREINPPVDPSQVSRYDSEHVEIFDSARKHGIAEGDILHAIAHALAEGEQDDGTVLYLGPDRASNLLEVISVIRDSGTEIVIHAMSMRPKIRTVSPRRGSPAMTKRKSFGRTKAGVELTEEVLNRMADEAEAGLDVSKLRRRPGRPAMGSGPASSVPVRLDPELRAALDQRAEIDKTTASHVMRDALRHYLKVS